jgi:putrescine aminotransferase
LLIADEVQTGLGRTGKLWGVEHWNVVPDILTVAKSLGGGVMPVSATITTEEIYYPMMYPNPFMHTTTTGGGALACSAAIAAIHVTLRERLWEQAADKGGYLMGELNKFAAQYPQIYEKITGKGLLIGMHFQSPEIGYKVASGLFKRNVLVAGTLTSAQTIRIEPPLIVTKEQIDMLLDRLSEVLREINKSM